MVLQKSRSTHGAGGRREGEREREREYIETERMLYCLIAQKLSFKTDENEQEVMLLSIHSAS